MQKRIGNLFQYWTCLKRKWMIEGQPSSKLLKLIYIDGINFPTNAFFTTFIDSCTLICTQTLSVYCLMLTAYMLPDPYFRPDHTKVVKIVPASLLINVWRYCNCMYMQQNYALTDKFPLN